MFLVGLIVGCFITLICFAPRMIEAEAKVEALEELSGELVIKFAKIKQVDSYEEVEKILNENTEVIKWKKM